jgi:hypothetical protein
VRWAARERRGIFLKKKGGEYYDVHSPSLFLKKKIYTTKIAGNVGEKFYSLPQVVIKKECPAPKLSSPLACNTILHKSKGQNHSLRPEAR